MLYTVFSFVSCFRKSNGNLTKPFINPRPGEGGATPSVFFAMHAELYMCRIVLKVCIAYGAYFAQLLVNKFDRVMSGHGAMTSQVVQGQAIFARNRGFLHIRKRYRP